jgi:hypothetical protein
MSASNKQIYIPSIAVKGSFIEEIGSSEDRLIYPGEQFNLTLSAEDFSNSEEYHTTWINITRAVKSKLLKDATSRSS